MLTSPIYGGAYTFGKTEHLVHYDNGKPRHFCRRKPRDPDLVTFGHNWVTIQFTKWLSFATTRR
ncbi:MAG TPA: hypothetical protein VMG82_05045 [Candidatus Sulfotelmatobacter sp.]|nr:hypothetical protein [Candidatus Sulfotelmatobacter sp.]